MLVDILKVDKLLDIVFLRYFNLVGVYKSGRIGEELNGVLSNLMFYIIKIVVGKLKELSVYGNDYLIYDGIGVRDYIYVLDLVVGYVKVL